jgi:type VI secretion system secreted protein VgrG
MVLANQKQAYADCPEQQVEFQRIEAGDTQLGRIHKWQHDYEFRSGKWAQTDYNFKTPSNSLLTNAETVVELAGNTKYEIFEFPGDYIDTGGGQTYTDIRMEEDEVPHNVASGTSSCKTFSPGHWFELTGHEIADEDGQYVITSIHHWANNAADASNGAPGGDEYGNSFTCIPKSVTYRPPRGTRRPLVRGPQVAVVTGPAGEEIYCDNFGRVKVHFPWDRESKQDENSSCWIRVSQVHAGKGFGGIDIPRIGDEVVITFYEGDPDRPIITGRLYHAENMPPFGLPGGMNVSGMKSNSTKGGGGYNELVLDDTKGNELIRLHGQFDMDSTIKHDLREHVLNDRTRDVTKNETITIGVDRKEKVGSNETIDIGSNRTETVGGHESITVMLTRSRKVGINESVLVGGAQEVTVGGLRAVSVGGAQTFTVGGFQAITVGAYMAQTVGGSMKESVGGSKTQSIGGSKTVSIASDLGEKIGGKHGETVAGDYSLKAANITMEADSKITLKTGSASITMESGGKISIEGTDITVIGSGEINANADGKMTLKGSAIHAN